MLSYNIENKFDKILERIKYKLDTKGLSKKEIFLKQNEVLCDPDQNPDIGDQVVGEYNDRQNDRSESLGVENGKKVIRSRLLSSFQFATNQAQHTATSLNSIRKFSKDNNVSIDKAIWEGEQAQEVSTYIKSFSNQLKDKFVNPLKTIARCIQGSVFSSGLKGNFGGKTNYIEVDTVHGTLLSRGMNGSKQFLTGLAHTIQNYTKRLRGANPVRNEDGSLVSASDTRFDNNPIAKRNQQMAIDWEGVIDSNGYKHLTNAGWKEFLKKEEAGKIRLFDTYDEDGNIDQQVPKSVIESIHNLDGPSIISAIKLIKTIGEDTYGEELGKIWSGDEDERLKFLEKIKDDPRIKDKIGLYSQDEEGKQIDNPNLDAKLSVFILALENREFCRTFNNQMQVVINGRDRIYKYARSKYNALLQNKVSLEHQGGEAELNDGQKVSRRGVIGEVAKWNVSKQLAIDWMKENKKTNEPLAQGDNPSMRLILIARYQGLEVDGSHVKVSSSPPSAITGVDTMITNAIQRKLKEANPKLGEKGFRYTQFVKTLREVFDFERTFKVIGEDGKTVPGTTYSTEKFLADYEIREKVMETIYNHADEEGKSELGSDLEEAIKNMTSGGAFEQQVDSVMRYLDTIRKTQDKINTEEVKFPKEGNSDSPEVAKQKDHMRAESGKLHQEMESDTVQSRYFRALKTEKNKLFRSLNADGSWSSEELPEEGGSGVGGYLNKSLDEYTMGQVIALENGRPSLKYQDGFQGASLWGFEDHHIYGKGDNQANTHFALVFRPFHQNGLHLTNFMIETYEGALDHIVMLAEYVENYEANKNLITLPENHLTDEQIRLIKLYANNPEELKKLYKKNKKGELRLMEGATIPTITTIPIDIGDNSTAIENRKRLGFMTPEGENKVMSGYFYPPITEKITGSIEKGSPDGYYEDTIRTRGGKYLSLWENGTILDTPRAFELDWIGEDENERV